MQGALCWERVFVATHVADTLLLCLDSWVTSGKPNLHPNLQQTADTIPPSPPPSPLPSCGGNCLGHSSTVRTQHPPPPQLACSLFTGVTTNEPQTQILLRPACPPLLALCHRSGGVSACPRPHRSFSLALQQLQVAFLPFSHSDASPTHGLGCFFQNTSLTVSAPAEQFLLLLSQTPLGRGGACGVPTLLVSMPLSCLWVRCHLLHKVPSRHLRPPPSRELLRLWAPGHLVAPGRWCPMCVFPFKKRCTMTSRRPLGCTSWPP